MDETPITHPGVPEEVYHTLGKKTFWIFLLERAHAAFILLLLTIALFILGQQSFLATTPITNLPSYTMMAAWICLALFVFFFLVTLLIAWLIYKNYKFCLGDDSLKIKRGILNKEEVAIPYRQIQDVDIRRDLSFQMIGLSRIVIITAGHDEDEKPGDEDTEGILPALDKDLAEWLQAELLKRANVQKVTEENPSPSSPSSS
jgi:putative membrane protein